MTALNEKLAQTRAGIADDRTADIVDGLREMQHLVRMALHPSFTENGSETGTGQLIVTLLETRSWSIGSKMQKPDIMRKIDSNVIAPMMATLAQALPASALPCEMVFDIRCPAREDKDVKFHHINLGGRMVDPFGRNAESWEKWLSYVIDTEFFIDDLVLGISQGDTTSRVFMPLRPDGNGVRFSAPTREAAAVTLLIREGGLHAIHALTGGMTISDVIELHDLFDVELAEVSATPFAADIGTALRRLSALVESRRDVTDADLQAAG